MSLVAPLLALWVTIPGLEQLELPQGTEALAPQWSARSATSGPRAELRLSWLEPVGTKTARSHRLRTAVLNKGRFKKAVTVWTKTDIFANWADVPSVSLAGDGSLLAHWAQKSSPATYAYDVRLAHSRRGRPFQELGAAHRDGTPTEHGFVSVVPLQSSFQMFWLDGRNMAAGPGQEPGAMTLRTATVDGSVSPGLVLDERVCECCRTSAALTAEGPIVFYRDRGEDEVRDISYVRRIEGGWSKPAVLHADNWKISGCPVNGPAAAASAKRVAVAWYTGADGGRVRVAFSNDAGRSFSSPIDVAHTRPTVVGRVDVALLKDGGAAVSWMVADDSTTGRILMRRVEPSQAMGAVVSWATVEPSRKSGFPRLLANTTHLYLSWTDVVGDKTSVKVARLPLAALHDRSSSSPPVTKAGALAIQNYQARDMAGQATSIASMGGPVLLNLWASWCRPCREEIPLLQDVHRTYGPRGLRVVGVNVDASSSDTELGQLVAKLGIGYTVWRDRQDRVSKVFGVDALPASFLLDEQGRIHWQHRGVLSQDIRATLDTNIRQLLVPRKSERAVGK